jgi:hypothetical protein
MLVKTSLLVIGLIFASAMPAPAKDPPSYEKGTLLSMDSSTCGTAEKGGKTVAGELLGTDDEHKATQQVLCQDYMLQGTRIVYRIRPVDAKHPALLPVGDTIEYRIHKDKMYVLDREEDRKEREYSVISMKVRDDAPSTPKEAMNH